MTTDRFDELQDGRKLTIKRADGGLLLTIATMHRMETVPLTEERAGDLARWLGGDEAQVERDEWKALAHSTEVTLKQQQGASIDQLAEANRTGQAMGEARGYETACRRVAARGMIDFADELRARPLKVEGSKAMDALVAKARTVEPDVAAQLERLKAMPSGHVDADPMRRLSTTDLDQVPPVDDAAVDRALMAGWAERTAAETPRSPTEPAAGYVVDADPCSPQGSGFTPRAVFPPQVAPGMQGAIDATHAHSAIVLASANRGTPAPEPEDRSEPPAWADIEGDPTSGFDLIERNGGTVVTGNIDRRALVEWAWGMHDTVRATPGSTVSNPKAYELLTGDGWSAEDANRIVDLLESDGPGSTEPADGCDFCEHGDHRHPCPEHGGSTEPADYSTKPEHIREVERVFDASGERLVRIAKEAAALWLTGQAGCSSTELRVPVPEGSTAPCSNCSGKGWTADEERLRFIYCECPKGVQRRQADESS